MSLSDILHVKKIKEENMRLRSLFTPELATIEQQKMQIEQQKMQIEQLNQQLYVLNNTIKSTSDQIAAFQNDLSIKKLQIVEFDEKLLYQDYGLYTPRFCFASSDEYKVRLNDIRQEEKTLIKNDMAVTGNYGWTVNGDSRKGTKMVKDMKKLLLRAFNSECDDAVEHVKYGNYEQSLKKITVSKESISKLGAMMQVEITDRYYNLKVNELALALEYQIKKNEEKEALKAARAEQREAAKLQKELDEQRKKIEKEQNHYNKAYSQLLNQLLADPANADLLNKKVEMEKHLSDIEKAVNDLDYREANQKAGYVYVISNIGSFGENVYKIGMTRRLDPQERIDELGDASVPFDFDVHAMIFSDDAPALEAALHRAFENKKLNMINKRREFFYASLDEIKDVIKRNYDKTVDFIEVPDAEQYRQSQVIRQGLRN